jgi:protein-S-isoprenylcysteine O-methyltransferase Ste14
MYIPMIGPGPNVSDNNPRKDAAAVRIFPPAVPLLTVFGGLALERALPLKFNLMLPAPLRYWVGAGIVISAVYLLGFKAVRTMRRSGQSENPYKKTTEIISTGPFSLTRNPMYLQMVLVCVGCAILFSSIWIIILTPICALLLHILVIRPEEIYLEQKFGDTYLDYKRRVRRWI